MHLGLVGLGKMGGNMRTRLRNGGITVVGYDRNPDVSDSATLAEMVEALPSPKVVWVMVPAGEPTRATIAELGELLGDGVLILDAGSGEEAMASESIEANISGDDLTTGFNPQFLLDGLSALETSHVELAFTTSAKPVVLSGVDSLEASSADTGSSFKYLLMPRRLLSS